eukprot:TRINITY_DN1550_c0_g2_i1.p1 TRINITY_DN1550_c0_g2~~TRINITY_DN1550_c0_g2_i1.p1  ORF type:complete len:600 (+),score=203.07 TRINITY_DN1550_c0_g2_i1:115-1914(+)
MMAADASSGSAGSASGSEHAEAAAGGAPAPGAGSGPMAFLATLRKDFGGEFLAMLFSSYFGVKGGLYTLVGRGQRPYYVTYMRTSAAQYQNYLTFAATPWAMKSLIGAVSDAVPIRGYHKVPYMIAATLVGVFAFILLVLLPLGAEPAAFPQEATANATEEPSAAVVHTAGAAALAAPLLFFLVNLQISVVDLLTEGRYAAMMVAKPETGSSLVTWVWACYFVGALFVSAWIGHVSEAYGARALFAAGVPFSLQVLVPLCLGYLKEKPALLWDEPDRGRCWPRIVEDEWRMYVLALLMTVGALVNSFTGLALADSTLAQLQLTWAWCGVMIAGSYWALPKAMASATTYMFLATALYLGIPGALDVWFTSPPPCVPDGPAFDDAYYMSYTGIVGSIAALGGVALFQKFFQNSTFRRAFWLTTVLKVIAALFDVVIVKRWHRPHVSDKAIYMFGDAIIGEVVGQLDFMPAVVLVSKLCPPGYESLVYAMLGGFQNFGMQVSRYSGAYLTERLGVHADLDTGVCNWDNLPTLIVVSHCVLPLITTPLTFWLLPDAKLTDDVLTTRVNRADGPVRGAAAEFEMMSDDDDDDLFSSDGDIQMAF